MEGKTKKEERWVEDAKVVAGGHTQMLALRQVSERLQHSRWQKRKKKTVRDIKYSTSSVPYFDEQKKM